MNGRLAGWLAMLLAASPIACAAGRQVAEPPPPPERPERPEPKAVAPADLRHITLTEVDALEHDLAVAEQRLKTQLVRRASYAHELDQAEEPSERERAREPSYATPAPTAPPTEAAERSARPQSWQPGAQVGSPCDMACRALGSMRRSADGICRIVGQGDDRCSRARERVAQAERRVREAGCRCASDAD